MNSSLLLLLVAASVHSAVIRTILLRGDENKDLAQALRSVAKEHLQHDASTASYTISEFEPGERRGIDPPWYKGRYGRELVLQNGNKDDQKAKGKKRGAKIATKSTKNQARETWHRSRYGRQMWHRQRYGREKASKSTADGNAWMAISPRGYKRHALDLSDMFNVRVVRDAPGWHHGRYGRRNFIIQYPTNKGKRDTQLWYKGRYAGREIADGQSKGHSTSDEVRDINDDIDAVSGYYIREDIPENEDASYVENEES